jgi:hypothetical protein
VPGEALEAVAHVVLDLAHVLDALGEVEQSVGACVLGSEAPDVHACSTRTLHELYRPFLAVLLGAGFSFFVGLFEFVAEEHAGGEDSVRVAVLLTQLSSHCVAARHVGSTLHFLPYYFALDRFLVDSLLLPGL